MKRFAMPLLALGLALLLQPSAPAWAATTPASFSIGPATTLDQNVRGRDFLFQMSGGAAVKDAVAITNNAATPLQFDLYGADVRQAPGGGLSPAQAGDPMQSVGAWITMDESHVVIPAGQRRIVGFTIAPPQSADPGDHLGAIVAQAIVGYQGGVALQARGALLTELVVPGKSQINVTLSPLAGHTTGGQKQNFTLSVANRGNLIVSISGHLSIRDSAGKELRILALQPSGFTLLRGASVDIHSGDFQFSDGTYHVQAVVDATVEGRPFYQQAHSAILKVDYVDWLILARNVAIAVAGTTLLAAAAFFLARRRISR